MAQNFSFDEESEDEQTVYRKAEKLLPLAHYKQAVTSEVNEYGTCVSIGTYLARRLASAAVTKIFTVPGDYTLSLLDEMTKDGALTLVGCCNELNAGYAADGYSRATGGMAVLCVTYM
jgi:hypothetical protein